MFLLKNLLTASAISFMLNMITEIEDAISFSFSFPATILAMRPTQVKEEILALLKILREI